jgi:hypothetical protein
MADEEQAGTSTRRAFVAQLVAGATVLAVASAIPTAMAGDKPPSNTPSDPAPSKSSWNFPSPSQSSVAVMPIPTSSPQPAPSSPPRSSTRTNSTDTTAPALPATPNKSFDLYNP